MIRICFVCLGNICRSPTAEGIMLSLVGRAGLADRFIIDSAGTGAWHVGQAADSRSMEYAKSQGVGLPSRARQFQADDFSRFDHVIAMDRENLSNLRCLAPSDLALSKLCLLREYDAASDGLGPSADVPDPYYGGAGGFAEVFDICTRSCEQLLETLAADLPDQARGS